MNNIEKVLGRIIQIELRHKPKQAANFNDFLHQAEISSARTVTNTTNLSEIKNNIFMAAKRYGVDPNLAMAVAQAESDFLPTALSPAGAVGVMQLMPETARSIGVRNINDIKDNIDGGVRYLKQLMDIFEGDVVKAVSAYNAGPQAVKNYNGVPPYPETQKYVKKVLSLYGQAL